MWAQPNPEWIRVALVWEDPQVELQVQGRFTVRALHTGEALREWRHLPQTTIRAVPEGIVLGAEVLPVFGVRIEPVRSASIRLNGTRLRGVVEIVRQENMTLLVINTVALEDYLRGVLSKEAPDYWPFEALKAIAIAARTYAIYQRFTKAVNPYDVTGDVLSQEYGGKTAEKAATTRAVKATAGGLLTYRGQLFPTFYHSTCGGMTEHARVMGSYDLTPLQGGVVCQLCSASPFFRWQRRLTTADLAFALSKSPHGSIGSVRDLRVTTRTASGRAEQIEIVGSRRTVRLSGFDFRLLFGFDRIRSPLFTVEPTEGGFLLHGRGWGHGVGMCQWGAAELARRGLSAPAILAYYYPGATLVSLRALMQQPVVTIGGQG